MSEQRLLRAADLSESNSKDAAYQLAIEQASLWVNRPHQEEALDAFKNVAKIRYRQYLKPRPLQLWMVRIDLTNPKVRCVLTEPEKFLSEDARFETRSATTLHFAKQHGVQLAINTSAFDPYRSKNGMPMDLSGLAAFRGKVYSDVYQPDNEILGAMAISREGRITLQGPPLQADENTWHIVPGFRMLVDDGEIAVLPSVHRSPFGRPQPRTAVGVDKTGQTLWIIVADGRQPKYSEGITLVELASFFKLNGVWDALNLDGGGSSTLVMKGSDETHTVINTPIGDDNPGVLRQVGANLGFFLPGSLPHNSNEKDNALRRE